jgi:predicted nucleic-acid-binding Zn-ribbon protein
VATTTLWTAAKAGWLLSLKCERTREGLKSVRACPLPITLHLPSLIAALGPDLDVEALQKRLRCPRCGSDRFSLRITAPPAAAAGAADARPVARQMRPARGFDTLASTPENWIVVTCDQCKRRGEYRKETLAAVFDPNIQMPELLPHIAAWRGCGLAKKYLAMSESLRNTDRRECRIVYDVDTS